MKEEVSEMEKKVSLIMPVFNSAPYLDYMLQSIYDQTYSNIELVIAYDDSKDGTLNILKNWKERFDKRGFGYIIVRNPKRAGIVNGINAAMPYSTGEYITFPDSDDYMLPEFVATMVEALERHPDYNWARCDNYKVIGRDIGFDKNNIGDFNSETEYGKEYDYAYDERFGHLGCALNLLLYTIPRAPWRMMCKREFLFRVIPDKMFYPHPSSHELPIGLPLAAAEEPLYVPKALYKYTIHKDGYYNSRAQNLHQMIPYLDSMELLASECINLLDIDDAKKVQFQLASRLYYNATKAYYSMSHGAAKLASIYAANLDDCMKKYSQNKNITKGFPYMMYWKYYFRLAPKIVTGIKMSPEREKYNVENWGKLEKLKVILYGAGHNCKAIVDILEDLGIQILEIWDRDADRIKSRYGYKVIKPHDNYESDDAIILDTILNGNIAEEAKKSLIQLGYNNVLRNEELDATIRYGMLRKYFESLVV